MSKKTKQPASDAQKLVDAGVKEMQQQKHGVPPQIAVPLLAKIGALTMQLDVVQRQLGDQIRRNYELERELTLARNAVKAWEVGDDGKKIPLDPETFETARQEHLAENA